MNNGEKSNRIRKQKSRDLPQGAYLEQLQLEYVVAELRKKIYLRDNDKNFYSRVMNKKQEKILDIAQRNYLPTIFDNPATKEKIYKKIYNEKGLPNFIYKDNETKNIIYPKDLKYYFSINSEVKVFKEDNIILGKILNVNLDAELIEVESESDFGVYPMSDVTRIL